MASGAWLREIFGLLKWPLRAICLLVGHLVLAAAAVASVSALSWLVHLLIGNELIWGLFPMSYLFQSMDLGVIVLVIWKGLLVMYRELNKE